MSTKVNFFSKPVLDINSSSPSLFSQGATKRFQTLLLGPVNITFMLP